MTCYAGRVICALVKNKFCLAYVSEQIDADSLLVLIEGQRKGISSAAIFHVFESTYSEAEFIQQYDEFVDQVDRLANELSIKELWSRLSPEKAYEIQELASVTFGQATDLQLCSLLKALQFSFQYFTRSNLSFLSHSQERVDELELIALKRVEKAKFRQEFVSWMKCLLSSERVVEQPAKFSKLIQSVNDYLYRRGGGEAAQILGAYAKQADESWPDLRELAFELLRKCGELELNADRFLAIAGVDISFPPNAIQECRELSEYSAANEPTGRSLLQGAISFSIDDEDTCEVDDALSCRLADDWIEIGVHIADVSYFVKRDSYLDLAAQDRAQSLYLPGSEVNMLPEILSYGLASLEVGKKKAVLSLYARYSKDYQLLDTRIEHSELIVDQRLDYDRADAILSQQDGSKVATALGHMHKIAKEMNQERQSNGALMLQRFEQRLKLRDGKLDMYLVDLNAPSRLLVSEWMIFYNQCIAEFGREQKLQLIYRTQAAPSGGKRETERRSEYANETAAQDRQAVDAHKLMGKMKASRLSIRPRPHYALGLSAYAQSTSPIRRYSDLITQRQLGAFLNDTQPMYDSQELMDLIAGVEYRAKERTSLAKRAKRFWSLEFMAQQGKQIELQARVIGLDKKGDYKIETVDHHIRGKLSKSSVVNVGDSLRVKIQEVSPRDALLVFCLA